jgi:hypothetical protein
MTKRLLRPKTLVWLFLCERDSVGLVPVSVTVLRQLHNLGRTIQSLVLPEARLLEACQLFGFIE